MAIEFIDLKSQYRSIREDVDRRIHAVLDHGQYIMGPEVFELEQKLAEYVGVKHCISASSGTDKHNRRLLIWSLLNVENWLRQLDDNLLSCHLEKTQ